MFIGKEVGFVGIRGVSRLGVCDPKRCVQRLFRVLQCDNECERTNNKRSVFFGAMKTVYREAHGSPLSSTIEGMREI